MSEYPKIVSIVVKCDRSTMKITYMPREGQTKILTVELKAYEEYKS